MSARIDPIVNEAVAKAKTAAQSVAQSAGRADTIKTNVDRLSTDLDAQTKRVRNSSADIQKRMTAFDDAQKQMESALVNARVLSQQVDTIQKSLQTKVQQISSQVDDVSVRQVFPNLGQKLYVTSDNQPWKSTAEKRQGEIWVNVIVAGMFNSSYSAQQVEQLLAVIRKQNFTPYIGRFGVAGPYSQAYESLTGGTGDTSVVYFRKSLEPKADTLQELVSQFFSRRVRSAFLDPSTLPDDDTRRMIIDRSGLDIQLVLGR